MESKQLQATIVVEKINGKYNPGVLYAAKKVGIKESRPNPFGLPDLTKPDNWEAPNHGGNTGILTEIFSKD